MSQSNSKNLHFSITSNRTEQTFTAKYPATMTLTEFKIKLELIVGVYRQDMRLQLREPSGKLLAEIIGDTRSLEQLGLADGLVVHVIDIAHNTPSFTGTEDAEKFVLTDEKYDARDESVRKWKQELFKKEAESVAQTLKIGSRCEVTVENAPLRLATIAHVGPVHFRPGVWVGVRYDEPIGKNDGSIEGRRYFECEPMHGGFVQPIGVKMIEST